MSKTIKSCLYCKSINDSIGYIERNEVHCGWDGYPSMSINPSRAEKCCKYEYGGASNWFNNNLIRSKLNDK